MTLIIANDILLINFLSSLVAYLENQFLAHRLRLSVEKSVSYGNRLTLNFT